MPDIIEITDLDRPELDVFARLTEAQLRRGTPTDGSMFIAEDPKVIACALDAGVKPVSLLTDRRLADGQCRGIIERCGDIPVYIAQSGLLERLTGYRLTRGALCAFRRPAPQDPWLICDGARRIAVLEGIADTTNMGAVFRSAAALGFDAVLLTDTCCDPLCRRAVRVSMGTVLLVPWARMGAEGDWPRGGLARLRELGFVTVAMALCDDSLPIDDARLRGHERLAVVLGTEGDGLSHETVCACDYTARIPMSHGVDSLNVAAAGAVAFWQLRG